MGEFEYETMELKMYSVSDKESKKKIIKITPCD